jgi:hypothetical protein
LEEKESEFRMNSIDLTWLTLFPFEKIHKNCLHESMSESLDSLSIPLWVFFFVCFLNKHKRKLCESPQETQLRVSATTNHSPNHERLIQLKQQKSSTVEEQSEKRVLILW